MILLGIIMLVFGAVFYYTGVQLNNDMDAQMESLFNDGVTNPGSTSEVIGILLMIAGVLLIIVGVVRKINANNTNENEAPHKTIEQSGENEKDTPIKLVCLCCGASMYENSKFCSKCGRKNEYYMNCPSCGGEIISKSLFCEMCGADITLFKYGLQDATAEDIIAAAYSSLNAYDFETAKALFDSAGRRTTNNSAVELGRLLVCYELAREEELATVKKTFWENSHFKNILSNDDEELKNRLTIYTKYAQALVHLENQKYEMAKDLFNEITYWKDSAEKAEYCSNKIIEKEKQDKEELAREAKNRKIGLIIGVSLLAIIITYITGVIINNEVVQPTKTYNKAMRLYENGYYDNAAQTMDSLGSFKDAERKTAEFYFKGENYLTAAEKYEQIHDDEKSTECLYLHAKFLYDRGNYKVALSFFEKVAEYKNSADMIITCERKSILSAANGETIFFGQYEQDNDTSNGTEAIEWIIAKKDGDKVLLVSSKILDCQKFSQGGGLVSWPNTFIRRWLNESFYNKAFDKEQKKRVLKTTVVTKDTTSDGEKITTNSNDYVFLLSTGEYRDMTDSINDPANYVKGIKRCTVTEYAKSQDDKNDEYNNGWASWYTREQNWWSMWAGGNYAPGSVDYDEGAVYHISPGNHTSGIRPCIWLDCSVN